MPEGAVPYKNQMMHQRVLNILYYTRVERNGLHFIEGADNKTPRMKKETMFVQMLEGLHKEDPELLVHAKDKKLHQKYKGFSHEVVKKTFNWNDDYMRLDK